MKFVSVPHRSLVRSTMSLDANVAQVVDCLNANALKAVFVVDEGGVLRGIVTDADFRRHMLAGGAMTDPVSSCMNSTFASAGQDAGRVDLIKYFNLGILTLPRVDQAGRLIEVIALEPETYLHDGHYKILWGRAAQDSADYIEPHLEQALLFRDRDDLWDFVLSSVKREGLWAEFGVFTGGSINYFAKARPDQTLYGFDSFEGLKEAWHGHEMPAGAFDLNKQLPKVRANVTLIPGWFEQTLPDFLETHPEPVAFLHLDADTYPSTAFVLDAIGGRIGSGSVIIFDEYLGYPNWRNGEYRAWREFIQRQGLQYRYLGFSTFEAAVLVL